jgi:hypothetical protein
MCPGCIGTPSGHRELLCGTPTTAEYEAGRCHTPSGAAQRRQREPTDPTLVEVATPVEDDEVDVGLRSSDLFLFVPDDQDGVQPFLCGSRVVDRPQVTADAAYGREGNEVCCAGRWLGLDGDCPPSSQSTVGVATAQIPAGCSATTSVSPPSGETGPVPLSACRSMPGRTSVASKLARSPKRALAPGVPSRSPPLLAAYHSVHIRPSSGLVAGRSLIKPTRRASLWFTPELRRSEER